MPSISSQMISCITAFRNPNGNERNWYHLPPDQRHSANCIQVGFAEIGYLLVIPFSIVETAIALVAKMFASCLSGNSDTSRTIDNWFRSSAFSIGWSTADAVANVLFNDLIVSEKVARSAAFRAGVELGSVRATDFV